MHPIRTIGAIPAKSDTREDQWLPLWLHLEDTAGVIEWLFDTWLSGRAKASLSRDENPDEVRKQLILLALVHDIGKATPAFAAHILRSAPELRRWYEAAGLDAEPSLSYEVTHARAGEVLLRERFGCEAGFASVVGAHHGKPQDKLFDPDSDWINYKHLLGKDENWQKLQDILAAYAQERAGVSFDELAPSAQSAQTLMAGLLIMADWIASNRFYFPLLSLEERGVETDVSARLSKALGRLHLPPGWKTDALPSWGSAIYYRRFGQGEEPFVPRAMQRVAAETAAALAHPGLLIIEAPMGCGKTEAALAAAELISSSFGCGGIFFGLPTQATSNGIFKRMLEWAQGLGQAQTIQLSHRMAALNPDYRSVLLGSPSDVFTPESELSVHSFFQGKKTALLASFVTGTVDQLLMAALRRKHVSLRHLALAGKVVIVDEVHAYDAYMSQYLQRALSWLGAWGAPVILLSATLPRGVRSRLMDAYLGKTRKEKPLEPWRNTSAYPLLTWSDGGKVFQTAVEGEGGGHSVVFRFIGDDDRIPMLRGLLRQGGCAGVLCNTVARAQNFARELEQAMPDTPVMLLHARFAAPQRAELETRILSLLGRDGQRPERLILVGTQVLEQSLDIDFDLLISDLCPVDLLLQRVGRLHRHERTRPAPLREALCCVTCSSDSEIASQRIYAPYLLLRTRMLLPEKVSLPRDISPLVQAVYDESDPPVPEDSFVRERADFLTEIREQEKKADAFRLSPPQRKSKFTVSTLHGLLDVNVSGDVQAEAAVRSGGTGVEVLLLRRGKGDAAEFVAEEHASIPLSRVPSVEEAIAVARQRLRLPYILCTRYKIGETIRALEELTRTATSEWQKSAWLQGELLLLLERNGALRLNGTVLTYDKKYGLLCSRDSDERKGDENESGL